MSSFHHKHYFVVYDSSEVKAELNEILKNPESAFNHSSTIFLKRGVSRTVVRIDVDQKRYVVKRYNNNHLLGYIKTIFRKTRAEISWRTAQKFNAHGIATPKPVALIEERYFVFSGKCYFITEFVEAKHIGEFFSSISSEQNLICDEKAQIQLNQMINQVAELFLKLSNITSTHGDLKMTNVLIDNTKQLILIDLDHAKQHYFLFQFRKKLQKDLKRFLKNFENNLLLKKLFKEQFEVFFNHGPYYATIKK